jgi:hypothetical protein
LRRERRDRRQIERASLVAERPGDDTFRMRSTFVVAASLFLLACGGSGSQIPVKGADSEIISIAGQWEGQYNATDAGRSGPITFSLEVGRHTADGTLSLGGQQPLKVSFVEVQGESGAVHGTVERYTDPSCNCATEAKFVGQVAGDRIEGTFTTTQVESGTTQRGTWEVTRVAK